MKLSGIDKTILVQSSNVDLGDALTSHCRMKIQDTAGKLFNHLTEASCHFKREGSMVTCSIRMKVNSLPAWAAAHEHHNPYRAFNYAIGKVATQMRRAKRSLHEDKPVRVDKDMAIIGADVGAKRKMLQPMVGDTGEPDYDLTTMDGADDFAKAMLQKSKQDAERMATQDDVEQWRRAQHQQAAE